MRKKMESDNMKLKVRVKAASFFSTEAHRVLDIDVVYVDGVNKAKAGSLLYDACVSFMIHAQ